MWLMMESISDLPNNLWFILNAPREHMFPLETQSVSLHLICLLLDLPEEIINEIILQVPLIDLFRVSKVCHLFKKLAYTRRKEILTKNEYYKACKDGDILSIIFCDHKYYEYALNNGCLNEHMEMIEKGVNYLDYGFNCACHGGHMEVCQFLIAKGAFCGNYALSHACLGGNMEIVQMLVEKGADEWNNCLIEACRGGNINIVQLMITNGADYWNEGLKGACEGGHIDIVKLMISKGANKWNDALHYSYRGKSNSLGNKDRKYNDIIKLINDFIVADNH